MARRAGLGRGLDALFADVAPINEEEYYENGLQDDANEDLPPPGGSDAKIRVRRAGRMNGSSGLKDPGEGIQDGPGGAGIESPVITGSEGPGSTGSDGINKTAGRSGKRAESLGNTEAGKKSPGASSRKSEAASDAEGEDTSDRIIYIDINDIRPNSAQPRKNFDEARLKELADSIISNGVIQPIIVRKSKTGYELVAGERRWRASRLAGLRVIPCIIRDFDDRQNAIVAIIENMQREDLNPIEEAVGLRAMTEKYGFTQEQISQSLGRSRTYIANSIRLLKLPPEIQEYVSSGQMSAAHGRTIINIADKDKQKEIADKIIRNDLSVRATEKLADKVKDELKPERKKRKKTRKVVKSEDVAAVEKELMTLTGTRVTITGDKSGRIEFEYYSIEELNRLIDMIREAFR